MAKKLAPVCDYCGKEANVDSGNLIVESPISDKEQNGRPAGSKLYICAECVEICHSMLSSAMPQKNQK